MLAASIGEIVLDLRINDPNPLGRRDVITQDDEFARLVAILLYLETTCDDAARTSLIVPQDFQVIASDLVVDVTSRHLRFVLHRELTSQLECVGMVRSIKRASFR